MIYNIPNHYKGDTFDGIKFTIMVNDQPLNLTGAAIRASFKMMNNEYFMNLNNGITILSALQGSAQIDPQVISWPAGIYRYDIEITISGRIKTYLKGEFSIIDDVTK